MNYTTWAKSNKKELVRKLVGEAEAPSQQKPVAVFMAGIPGAGKTEFIKRLFSNNSDAVKIDLDEIVKLFPNYSPDRYYQYRTAANIIVDECVIFCRKHSLNFILDGTFGYGKATDNITSALKRHDVVVVYIWKDPSEAWRLTQDRELTEKRAIDRDGFIVACMHVPENIQKVRKMFGDKISVVAFKKAKESNDFEMTQDLEIIDDLIKKRYTKEELEKIL